MKIWSVAAITIYSRICRNTERVNTKGVWLENLLKMRMNPLISIYRYREKRP